MHEESPFASPQTTNEIDETLDERSREIFRVANGLRWLEIVCAFSFGGLLAPLMILAEIEGRSSNSLTYFQVVLLLGSMWAGASLLVAGVIFCIFMWLDVPKRHFWMVAIAALPLLSIFGTFPAARLLQHKLRSYGLQFGWIGPSQKQILEQLRHHDGTPADPKTLGMK